MTRDETLELMGRACREHLSATDALLVFRALTEQPKRMIAYLNSDKKTWTTEDFAAFALRCAKRVLAGGES